MDYVPWFSKAVKGIPLANTTEVVEERICLPSGYCQGCNLNPTELSLCLYVSEKRLFILFRGGAYADYTFHEAKQS